MNVGVLALQGGFAEHLSVLQRLEVPTQAVRIPADMVGLQGLIIPGGESTTLRYLMAKTELDAAIQQFAEQGGAVWGTCAGAIVMSQAIQGDSENIQSSPLGLLDMTVQRNAFGRQIMSGVEKLALKPGYQLPQAAVLIRAPSLCAGRRAQVIAALSDGQAMAVVSGRCMATAFHPELTNDTEWHRWFVRVAMTHGLTFDHSVSQALTQAA